MLPSITLYLLLVELEFIPEVKPVPFSLLTWPSGFVLVDEPDPFRPPGLEMFPEPLSVLVPEGTVSEPSTPVGTTMVTTIGGPVGTIVDPPWGPSAPP